MKSRREVKVSELEETLKNQFQDKLEDKSIAIVTRAKAKVNQEFVMMFVENAQTALNDLTKSEFKVLLSIAKLAQYQNVFNVTQSAVSEDCKVNQSDVSRTMKKLREKRYLLKHPTNKMEYINPNLFTKGGINQIRADKNGVMAALNDEPNLFENSIERVF